MKKITITYWAVTVIMAAFIFLGAILDVSRNPGALALIQHLGYPAYIVPFIGVMKFLGIVAVLIPGSSKLREWAYAGLVFDTFGALFSHLSSGDGPDKWFPALLGLILVVLSYSLLKLKNKKAVQQIHA